MPSRIRPMGAPMGDDNDAYKVAKRDQFLAFLVDLERTEIRRARDMGCKCSADASFTGETESHFPYIRCRYDSSNKILFWDMIHEPTCKLADKQSGSERSQETP